MAASKTTTPASTTVKVATLTGAAKDDVFSGLTENNAAKDLNVLANDPGAAKIWSLDQSATNAPLGSQMPSNVTVQTLASGATISLNADGTIHYDAAGYKNLQNYAEGEAFTDSFTYVVRMANGALSTATVTVNLVGSNDAPVVASALKASTTEDGTDITLNLLQGASDVDHGAVLSATNVNGLTAGVTQDGNTLKVDADHTAFQELSQDETRDITVNYKVTDEHGASVDQTATVTITGVNDAPIVADPLTAGATEDGADLTVNLLQGATDVDHNAKLNVTNLNGLTDGVTQDGNTLKVEAGNAAFQHLGAGKTTDVAVTYDVTDEHGAKVEQTATVTITGVNDQAVISGSTSGNVAEDGTLTAVGQLTVADVDDNESAFLQPDTLTGLYGEFTFDVDTGAWTYTLDNNRADVQALNSGESLSDTLSVRSVDGTTADISVLIAGVDEPLPPPTLGGNNGGGNGEQPAPGNSAGQGGGSKQNNGFGNGDQTAPGGSTTTNGAENSGGGSSTPPVVAPETSTVYAINVNSKGKVTGTDSYTTDANGQLTISGFDSDDKLDVPSNWVLTGSTSSDVDGTVHDSVTLSFDDVGGVSTNDYDVTLVGTATFDTSTQLV